MKMSVGVDLHKGQFTVYWRSEDGINSKWARYQTNEGGYQQFIRALKSAAKAGYDSEVAVESTGNTRYFKRRVEEAGVKVRVINTLKFKVINESVKKTDRRDAARLAFFLSKGMLPELRMKDEHRERLHSLCRTRDKLVKQRTQLKNKINGVLAGCGVLLKREELSSEAGLRRVLSYEIEPLADLELEVLVEQIRGLNAGIRKLEARIKEEGSKYEAHRILKSIKGIGDKGASILLSVIGDVNDFSSAKKLASYFGLVPRVSNSNEVCRSGRITKRGTKLGRTTLVQCGLVAKKYSPYLREYHERIKRRRGGGKANIALARKLLEVVYMSLKGRWLFTDFPRFKYERLGGDLGGG